MKKILLAICLFVFSSSTALAVTVLELPDDEGTKIKRIDELNESVDKSPDSFNEATEGCINRYDKQTEKLYREAFYRCLVSRAEEYKSEKFCEFIEDEEWKVECYSAAPIFANSFWVWQFTKLALVLIIFGIYLFSIFKLKKSLNPWLHGLIWAAVFILLFMAQGFDFLHMIDIILLLPTMLLAWFMPSIPRGFTDAFQISLTGFYIFIMVASLLNKNKKIRYMIGGGMALLFILAGILMLFVATNMKFPT